MATTLSNRNSPPWIRDELIVVLRLYREALQGKFRRKNPDEASLREHSDLLRNLAKKKGIDVSQYGEGFRSFLAVEIKIRSFYRLNPLDERKGLKPSEIVIETWNEFTSEFAEDKINQRGRLDELAEQIISSIKN